MPQREVSLPPGFEALQGRVHYVQRVSDKEMSSSCPQCGGDVHHNGEWPDRLRIFTDGSPQIWCRRCGYQQFADQLDPDAKPPTWQEVSKWRQEQERRTQETIKRAQESLTLLQESNIWARFHEHAGEVGRQWWAKRGVPEPWQSFWQLGYDPDHHFPDLCTDVATIPVFGFERNLRQIKYRLQNERHGRYRYHLSGLEAPPFLCDPDGDPKGHIVAVEGEIKAMVTFARLDDESIYMIGMPGTNPGAGIIETLRQADRVTLVLDPGAKLDGLKIAKQIGIDKTWLLVPVDKVDDMILSARLGKMDVRRLLSSALELSQFVTG